MSSNKVNKFAKNSVNLIKKTVKYSLNSIGLFFIHLTIQTHMEHWKWHWEFKVKTTALKELLILSEKTETETYNYAKSPIMYISRCFKS